MSDFAKMDVFFIVTTAVVVMLGIVVTLILFRVWRILGHVERISQELSEEAALLRGDVAEMRANIKREGFKLMHLGRLFTNNIGRFWKRKKGGGDH